MVLKTFILLISALSFTSSQQMTCTYLFNPNVKSIYQCDLSVNNPNGLDDTVSIGGVHLGSYMDPYGNQASTYNDSSVEMVRTVGQTKNIPSSICTQFSNAKFLSFSDSKIEIFTATKCSKATQLYLSGNLIEEVLTDICQFQPALERIDLGSNKLKVISNVALKSCKSLTDFIVYNNQISAISSTFFATTPLLSSITISTNSITSIPVGLFNGLTQLAVLMMDSLLITDLPLNVFPASLNFLSIGNNTFAQYRPEWFMNLNQLTRLTMSYNRIPVPANLFKPMTSLQFVFMVNCNISAVDPQWFSTLTSLFQLDLYRNNITEIPDNTFATTTSLRYLDISFNKLKTIRSKWFSNANIQNIYYLNVNDNEVNAIDPLFFELATNLNGLYLNKNKCYSGQIVDFRAKRSTYMPGFKTCIDNFGLI